jgi:hypothetical protein
MLRNRPPAVWSRSVAGSLILDGLVIINESEEAGSENFPVKKIEVVEITDEIILRENLLLHHLRNCKRKEIKNTR